MPDSFTVALLAAANGMRCPGTNPACGCQACWGFPEFMQGRTSLPPTRPLVSVVRELPHECSSMTCEHPDCVAARVARVRSLPTPKRQPWDVRPARLAA